MVENRGMGGRHDEASREGAGFGVLQGGQEYPGAPGGRKDALRRAGRLNGRPLAYGIGPDPVAVAKVLNDFAKGHDKFVITGGGMPGQTMSVKQIAALAGLPSRDELIAKLMGTMQAPVTALVRTLNDVPSKLVRALAAVRDAKEAAQASAEQVPA